MQRTSHDSVTAAAGAATEAGRRGPRRFAVRRSVLAWAGGLLLAAAALFTLYLRQSLVAPFNADGASAMLQAQAMLHGNLLLKGWWIADVSFYTTELPEYMIVTALRGLRPDVVHICGALTYTLMVLLAAMLARGRAKGREGLVRALVAGAIMLAPSVLGGTEVFLENPDHAGTAVPILALFLLLDRASPTPEALVGPAGGLRGARRGADRGPARARRGDRADRRRRRGPAGHAGAAATPAAGVLVRRGAARRGRGVLRAGQRLAASDPQVRRLLSGSRSRSS